MRRKGKAILQYIIEKDGSVNDVRVLRAPSEDCGAEAKRVVESMPKWIPGKQRGQLERVQYTLPIRFKIENRTRVKVPNKRFSNPRTSQREETQIFKIVEDMPRFPGCEEVANRNERKKCSQEKMLKYVYENMKYPTEAKNKSLEGKVIVQFVVNTDGSIGNVKIIRDIGAGCGTEAVRVVKSMPKWIPGKQRGQAVKVQYNLPINFKL